MIVNYSLDFYSGKKLDKEIEIVSNCNLRVVKSKIKNQRELEEDLLVRRRKLMLEKRKKIALESYNRAVTLQAFQDRNQGVFL